MRWPETREMSLSKLLSSIYKNVVAGFHERGVERGRQDLQEQIIMSLYCQGAAFVYHMFSLVLADSKQSFRYSNVLRFTPSIPQTRSCKSSLAHETPLPAAFETIVYLHALMLLEKYVNNKLVSTLRNYNSGMWLRYAGQLLLRSWNACTREAERETNRRAKNSTYSTISAHWWLRIL